MIRIKSTVRPQVTPSHNEVYLNAWVELRRLRGWTEEQINRTLEACKRASSSSRPSCL
jgi:hypothetical protein